MPRPCQHADDLLPPHGPPWAEGQCRACWLYVNRNDYRDHWAGLSPPTKGPGTELKAILASLGLHGATGCGCDNMAAQMDRWAVAGCREHADEIAGWLREQAATLGWLDKFKAGVMAASAGLVLNPLDPAPGLLREAIHRADKLEG